MTLKLIVALDFDAIEEAQALIKQLDPTLCILKIGSELFTRAGPLFVKELVSKGFKIFLDLKFHDIPNTVAKACCSAADLGVWMVSLHALGGSDMMSAASKALDSYGKDRPLLIAVTVLTSLSSDSLPEIGIVKSLEEQVGSLAQLAQNAGLDGVVCSAHEVKAIKNLCTNQFITVTPGIRLPTSTTDDQSRIMTPKEAMKEGSDYIVMGRPITKAANPIAVINEVLADLA